MKYKYRVSYFEAKFGCLYPNSITWSSNVPLNTENAFNELEKWIQDFLTDGEKVLIVSIVELVDHDIVAKNQIYEEQQDSRE